MILCLEELHSHLKVSNLQIFTTSAIHKFEIPIYKIYVLVRHLAVLSFYFVYCSL